MVMVRSDIPPTIEDRFERQDRGEARLGQANEWSLNAAVASVPPWGSKAFNDLPASHDGNSSLNGWACATYRYRQSSCTSRRHVG
jgi:hypothetical protein